MGAGADLGVPAVEIGDRWALRGADWSAEIDPRLGARLCAFSLEGRNILTGPEIDAANFGSTFWTSPQSDWGWPPIPEIDHRPYTVVESESGLVCCGSLASKLGVIVTKRFKVLGKRNALSIEYEISNQTSETLRLAPWEISRVRGGLTLFATGEARYPKPDVNDLRVEDAGGITWFKYDRSRITADQKLFAHTARGWLAHIDGEHALIKEFEPIAADRQAPGEAVVELFASGERDYVEIEEQGAYSKIGPWKASNWQVVWRIRKLPRGLAPRVGNVELVHWVEEQIAG